MSRTTAMTLGPRLLLGLLAPILLLSVPLSAMAQPDFTDRPITNNAFAPTGYTLHKGEFTVGIAP